MFDEQVALCARILPGGILDECLRNDETSKVACEETPQLVAEAKRDMAKSR